ncbi:hypothetical protein DL96DRAFT_1554283 [Flagelloscypha sp. PMI_526]|nr:hypothetical protein DL96DRAFT_1554283 [Flagelloscypha sp. PMI_526]
MEPHVVTYDSDTAVAGTLKLGNAQRFLNCLFSSYSDLNSKLIEQCSVPELRARIYPEALKSRERNKEEYIGFLDQFFERTVRFTRVEFAEVLEAGNVVIVHLILQALYKNGTFYNNECIFNATFNNDGQIIYIKEFVGRLEHVGWDDEKDKARGGNRIAKM